MHSTRRVRVGGIIAGVTSVALAVGAIAPAQATGLEQAPGFGRDVLLSADPVEAMAVGDLNADGLPDIVITSRPTDGALRGFVYQNDPSHPGSFLPRPIDLGPCASQSHSSSVAVLAAGRVALGCGTPNLTYTLVGTPDALPAGAVAVGKAGLGPKDRATVAELGDRVYVVDGATSVLQSMDSAAGNQAPMRAEPIAALDGYTATSIAAFTDVTGAGWLVVGAVVPSQYTEPIKVVLLRDGAQSEVRTFEFPYAQPSLTVRDLNADGRVDVAVTATGFLLQDGSGAMSWRATVQAQPRFSVVDESATCFPGTMHVDAANEALWPVWNPADADSIPGDPIRTGPVRNAPADIVRWVDMDRDGRSDLVYTQGASGLRIRLQDADAPLVTSAATLTRSGDRIGDRISLEVGASDGSRVQWQRAQAGSDEWVDVPSGTRASHEFGATAGDQGKVQYRAMVWTERVVPDGYSAPRPEGHAVFSCPTVATVAPPSGAPVLHSGPKDITGLEGSTVVLWFDYSTPTAAVVEWFLSTEGGVTSLGTGDSQMLKLTKGMDGATFWAVVTNAAGKATTAPAHISVTDPGAPVITRQPLDVTGMAGTTGLLSVGFDAVPPYSVQWKRADGTRFGTGGEFEFTLAPEVDGLRVAATIRNAGGTITSQWVTVTVLDPTIRVTKEIPSEQLLLLPDERAIVQFQATGGHVGTATPVPELFRLDMDGTTHQVSPNPGLSVASASTADGEVIATATQVIDAGMAGAQYFVRWRLCGLVPGARLTSCSQPYAVPAVEGVNRLPVVAKIALGDIRHVVAPTGTAVITGQPTGSGSVELQWWARGNGRARLLDTGPRARIELIKDLHGAEYWAQYVGGDGTVLGQSTTAVIANAEAPEVVAPLPSEIRWLAPGEQVPIRTAAVGGLVNVATPVSTWEYQLGGGDWLRVPDDWFPLTRTTSVATYENGGDPDTPADDDLSRTDETRLVGVPPALSGAGESVRFRETWTTCVGLPTAVGADGVPDVLSGCEVNDALATRPPSESFSVGWMAPPTITRGLPQQTAVPTGSGATLGVEVDASAGRPDVSWEYSDDGVNWHVIPRAEATSYTLNATDVVHQRSYRVHIVNAMGEAWSSTRIFKNTAEPYAGGESTGWAPVKIVNLVADANVGSVDMTLVNSSSASEMPHGNLLLRTGDSITAGWHHEHPGLIEYFDLKWTKPANPNSAGSTPQTWQVRIGFTAVGVDCQFMGSNGRFERYPTYSPYKCWNGADNDDWIGQGASGSALTLFIVTKGEQTMRLSGDQAASLATAACAERGEGYQFTNCSYNGSSIPVDDVVARQEVGINCSPTDAGIAAQSIVAQGTEREWTVESGARSVNQLLQFEFKLGHPGVFAASVYVTQQWKKEWAWSSTVLNSEGSAHWTTIQPGQVGIVEFAVPVDRWTGEVVISFDQTTARIDGISFDELHTTNLAPVFKQREATPQELATCRAGMSR